MDFQDLDKSINELLDIVKGKPSLKPEPAKDIAKKIDSKPEISSTVALIYQAPIKGTYYNSGNFSPNAPTDARHKKHDGVDLRASGGTAVYPMTDGIVTNISSGGIGGNTISIEHPNKAKTYYAHLGTIKINKGDKVTKDTVIGTVGDSGNAAGTAPHVHFQVWMNGQLRNPADFFLVPKYTSMGTEEKLWESEASKQEAKNFNLAKHIKPKSAGYDANRLEKLASIYSNLSNKF